MNTKSDTYWKKRFDSMYYKYVDALVSKISTPGDSIIDIGSNGCPYMEKFDWAAERVSVDLRNPYSSQGVKGIKADFYTWNPGKKFSIALCLQVLEHLDQPTPFIKKLFSLADHVIISVPYQWPKGQCKYHVQDPIDAKKLFKWAGQEPKIKLVIPELVPSKTSRRLLAYYNFTCHQTESKHADLSGLPTPPNSG